MRQVDVTSPIALTDTFFGEEKASVHLKPVDNLEVRESSSARATILIVDDVAEWRAQVREILRGRPWLADHR